MTSIINTLIPVLLLIPLGYFLKRLGLFKKEDTGLLTKLIINLLLPAVIFHAFLQLELKKELWLLPLSGLIIIFLLFLISLVIGKILKWDKKLAAAFSIIFASMEGGLIGYPLFLILFKEEGLAAIALWDIANTLVVFTFLYFWAGKYGKESGNLKASVKKMITCPIPLAMILGIILNALNFSSLFIENFIAYLGNATPAIIMLTLGIALEPTFKAMKLPIITILLKTIIGLALAILIINLFNFTGLWRLVTLVAATLPAPAVIYIFAAKQKLNPDFVANYLSLALPIGVIIASLILTFA